MASPIGVILNSINNKGPLLEREFIEKEYTPYVINRSLSYFLDTVLFVQEIDKYPNMSKWDQYLYYYHSVDRKRRFQKWHKPEKDKYLEDISEFYNVSKTKAIQALKLLSVEQCEAIKKRNDKGGRR